MMIDLNGEGLDISIVIPVYNTGKYLDLCMESVLAQTFTNYEVILVDDGSTDGSAEICDKWASDNEKISVLHLENSGAAVARNIGAQNARGRYIAFVDSDDTVSREYLSVLYDNLDKNNADISVAGYQKVLEGEQISEADDENITECLTGAEAMEKLLYQRGVMSVPWGFIVSKELCLEVPFPGGRRVEDYATIYKLFSKAKRIVFSNRVLYRYFIRPTSTVFASSAILKNTDYYMHGLDMIAYVSKEFPKYVAAAYSRHFSACFQILSETKKNEESKELLSKVYGDIRKYRSVVAKDKKTRKANKIAAYGAMFSISLMHKMLLIQHGRQVKKISK